MFAEERQNMIVSLVNKKGSVRVKDLSEQFEVTEDCIRKDLTLLEKKGLLRKMYGGAVKKRVNVYDFDVSQRREKNIEAKQSIAEKAFDIIKDGDMIFLDISTANLELAKMLVQSSKTLTVVTNMIDIMNVLMAPSNVQLIFIGGTFGRGRDGFIGSFTINQLSAFRFDIAFLGNVGVDLYDNSVATYMMEDGLTKKAIMDASKRCYMMLETRKFNTDGTYKYARVDDFTGAIMDMPPSADFDEKMREFDLDWIV